MGENEWIIDKLSSKYSMAPSSTDILTRYLNIESFQKGYQKIVQKVAEFDPMTRKIFYLKYQSLLENKGKEKSNREIGEQIGYSEEYVRKKIDSLKKQLLPLFSTHENEILL
jgi:hypothetical protein